MRKHAIFNIIGFVCCMNDTCITQELYLEVGVIK